MANQKLGNLGTLGKVCLSFPISEFLILPTVKIENSDLKISEKNFQDFRVFNLA